MLEIRVNISCPDLVMAATLLAKAQQSTAPEAPQPAPPVAPAPAPIPAVPAAAVPVAAPMPTTAPPTAQPQAPATAAPTYELNQLANAGALLAKQGKVAELQALLPKYGVATISELDPSLYGAFATDLRGLGAQI